MEKVKILPEPTGFPAEYRSDHYEEAYAVFLICVAMFATAPTLTILKCVVIIYYNYITIWSFYYKFVT